MQSCLTFWVFDRYSCTASQRCTTARSALPLSWTRLDWLNTDYPCVQLKTTFSSQWVRHHSNLIFWHLSQFKHHLTRLSHLCAWSGFQGRFHGRQPSMKFVMDTSKFWFRPHISRAEGENLKTNWLMIQLLYLGKLFHLVRSSFSQGCRILLKYIHSNKNTFATV